MTAPSTTSGGAPAGRRRSDVPPHLGEQVVAHPLPRVRVEGGEPPEVLAYGEREAGREARQVGVARPVGELRRHRRREREPERDPVADHVGAGGEVAEPLAALADSIEKNAGMPENT